MFINKTKKVIASLICNKLFGYIIKITGIKRNIYGGYFNYKTVSSIEAASIFFGIWESAEIRFAKKYTNCNYIIELGSSVGVLAGVISKLKQNTTIIMVEASPLNQHKLSILVEDLKKLSTNKYIIISAAIAYFSDTVIFRHTGTVKSSLLRFDEIGEEFEVKCTTLSEIVKIHVGSNQYALISDIEGSESEILQWDKNAFENCRSIIVELEDTRQMSIDAQVSSITEMGFQMKEYKGNVFAFIKE
jgi:FkbM family methyltransferase